MSIEAIAGGIFVVIIIALVITNPSGDTAVLGGTQGLVTGVTDSLQKGVK
jgi:hypothetical protein